MSDGPSTRDRRITRACFRICSTCQSHSQPLFYPYALRAIANRAESSIALLRYSLGGDRPSQTAQLPRSRTRIHGIRLEFYYTKGGISPAAPPGLAPQVPSLPPILHKIYQNPMIAYSKGSRGLSVLVRGCRIFTTTQVSPSVRLRQCSSRSTIHARRNLPDKELRYLRTVIVTAALQWGFGSELAPLALTFHQRASVSLYTASCDLAQTCVFVKQSLLPLHCGQPKLAPLLPKLRGQFAEFLKRTSLGRLRFFTLPTCVGFGTGALSSNLWLFSALVPVTSSLSGLAFLSDDRRAPLTSRG